MTHATALRRRQPGDIGRHRLFHVLLDELRGFRLLRTADLADHHHRLGVAILLESSRISLKEEPLIGSPPIPTLVDTPIPSSFICEAAS